MVNGSLFVNFSPQINRLYKIPTAQPTARGTRLFEPYLEPLLRAEPRAQRHPAQGRGGKFLLAFFENRDRVRGHNRAQNRGIRYDGIKDRNVVTAFVAQRASVVVA